MKEKKVPAKADGLRIDIYLAQALDVSRSKIQQAIKRGDVKVNGTSVTPHAPVSTGDKVSLPSSFDVALTTKKQKPPSLTILYEDDDVVVFVKPAGMLAHAAPGRHAEPTVVDALVATRPGMKKVGDDPTRPGIVHRLDRLASGVMIAAKNDKAFEFLKHQFSSRAAKKEYLVLVYGKLLKDTGSIRLSLMRSKKRGRMVALPEGGEGKEAITHYEALERFETTTFLRAKIETGRTHQIRAHFRALNHPVVGDPLYYKIHMRHIKPIPLDRLFLHAAKLTIALPNGETKTFAAPLPEELASLLKTLPKK